MVLSPHLDDAVLSVGGLVSAWTRGGGKAVLTTVFTADEPNEPPSAVAEHLHRLWGGPGAMARRRDEDARAAALLGAQLHHLGLADALHRCDAHGHAVYSSLSALFRKPAAGDSSVSHEIAAALEPLDPSWIVLAPLGIGRHVDHCHTRDGAKLAAQRASLVLTYYEDFPYNEKRLAAWGLRRGLEPLVVPLSAEAVAARCAAIAAYPSQVVPLFGSESKMRSRVTRVVRRLGGERLWVPSTPAAAVLRQRLTEMAQ